MQIASATFAFRPQTVSVSLMAGLAGSHPCHAAAHTLVICMLPKLGLR